MRERHCTFELLFEGKLNVQELRKCYDLAEIQDRSQSNAP